MSKKIVNLGKVKARTKELRLNDTVIEHKYDDEQDWQPLVDLGDAGSSIDTVSGYSELPIDAKENDVAIVEKEEYIRTENKTVVLPIEVKLPAEDQYIPNIYSINFKDKFNTLLDNEELKSMGAYAISASLETEYKYIQYMDINPELASAMIGVNHPVIMVMQSESGSENMNLYLEGVSARDFAIMQMELELEEEQWATLLGDHANDSSADNPSYGWIQLLISNEPINENSVDCYGVGIYATVIFDAKAPKFNDMLGYISVSALDANGNELIYASTSMYGYYDSHDDYDPEETAFAIKYANLALNNIAHGGMFEQSNDIYNPKGLFQNDNGEWVSLEEKMNTPRFVDTYADLPKTSIENGIMAVAKESVYRSESELTTKLESFKKYRINSVGDMTAEIFNSIIEEILPGYPTMGSIESYLSLMSLVGDTEMQLSLIRTPYSDTEIVCGIMMSVYDYEADKEKRILYIIEAPIGFEFEGMFPPEQGSNEPLEFSPEVGKWYWCDVVDDGKDDSYSVGGIHEGFPTDLPGELLFGYGEIYWDEELYPAAVSEVSTYGDDPSNYKDITSIDLKVFNFEDLSSSVSITYPAGFYRYNDNEWKHVEDVSGGNFENEDVLRAITATDVGNIQENTEKRHEHDNQYYLDQIQWDTFDKINRNTDVRHTHSNKDILDKIDYYKMEEINQSLGQRHTHNNQTYLDQINYYKLNEIASNTSARHSHSNLETLNKFNDVAYSRIHYHHNEDTLSGLAASEQTLLYNGYPINSRTLGEQVTDDEIENGINLKAGVFKYYNGSSSLIINHIPVGVSYLKMSVFESTGLYIYKPINWKNGVCPPICGRDSTEYYYDIIIKFTASESYIWGEWSVESRQLKWSPIIDSRLIPVNSNCNFAKITDGRIIFAPICSDGYYYNDEKTYLIGGYKRVVGEDPHKLSSELMADDECQLMFKEYDDFIIVYWIVTPKGYRVGEYINSSYITDWNRFFSNYDGEDVNDLLIGDLDTSSGTDFTGMFMGCSNITKLPSINTTNGIYFTGMFMSCLSLEYIPEIDLRKAIDASGMFTDCTSLITIEKIKCNSLKTSAMWGSWLYNCHSLENVAIEGTIKVDSSNASYADSLNLLYSPNLTADSLMSFINAFEDNTGEEAQYTVIFGATNLAKLTPDQIAVVINKNILLA